MKNIAVLVSGGGDGNGTSDGTKPKANVPTKKWNRFNI